MTKALEKAAVPAIQPSRSRAPRKPRQPLGHRQCAPEMLTYGRHPDVRIRRQAKIDGGFVSLGTFLAPPRPRPEPS